MTKRTFHIPAPASMRIRLGAALLAVGFGAAGCDLDLQNPNDPTEQEVVVDPDGIVAVAVGLQSQYATSVLEYTRAPALVTDQWGTAARSLLADRSLFLGEDVLPDYGVVTAPYATTYRIARTANLLIDRAPRVDVSRPVQVGTVALAKLIKAMALGNAALQFERLPIDADLEGGQPQPRAVVLQEVIDLLESARTDLGTVTDAELAASFNARVLGGGINLRNTVDAMLARYFLILAAERNDPALYRRAIEAAGRVSRTAVSVLPFPNPNVNEIYSYSLAGAQYVAALRSFVTEAEPGDQRPAFWVDVTATPIRGNPTDTLLLPFRAFADRNDPIPVYLPDEMLLIRAEAHTQLGEFEQARALINEVRTQTGGTATDPAAGLPALSAEALDTREELLRQIAYERQYELYWVGTRWSDLRRLDAFVDEEPSIQFLPFPLRECQINPNANCGS